MADEPEEGFTIRDRRRVSSDAVPVPPADSSIVNTVMAPATAFDSVDVVDIEDADEDEMLDLNGEAGDLPDVYSVLALFLGELRNLAWLRMGLLANPGTGEIERDLPQARVAIDTAAFLADQLKVVAAPEEQLPLKALISDLQVNFVEQSKRSS